MSEDKLLAKIVITTLIIGVGAALFFSVIPFGGNDGKLTVSEYSASLSEDGKLSESYTYNVQSPNTYHMLYRTWDVPLSSEPLDKSYVRFLGITPPADATGYMKDYRQNFSTYGPVPAADTLNRMKALAKSDEAGFFLQTPTLAPGIYRAGYDFEIHPPVEYDNQYTYLNVKFAGNNHVSYDNVRITVPAKFAGRMYLYPPTLQSEKNGDTVVITGCVAGNENLAVEFFIPNNDAQLIRSASGGAVRSDDVYGSAQNSNMLYNLPYALSTLLKNAGILAVLLTPFLLVVLCYRFGREKKFTVPEFFSTVPDNHLRPWRVNLLFRNDTGGIDMDAFYATLLDFQRRHLITIREKEDKEHLEIQVVSRETPDAYEKRVLSFLTDFADNGVFDTERIAVFTRNYSDPDQIRRGEQFRSAYRALTGGNPDPALSAEYLSYHTRVFIPLCFLSLILIGICSSVGFLSGMTAYISGPAVALWIIVLIQLVIARVFSPSLFAQWKGDHYREKLEWDAFTRFLSDLAKMKNYTPADISMWGEWLVYGTALGVGDKVEEAMASLPVPVTLHGTVIPHHRIRGAFAIIAPSAARGRGGSGGGHGGGGGFGGGGAGGR